MEKELIKTNEAIDVDFGDVELQLSQGELVGEDIMQVQDKVITKEELAGRLEQVEVSCEMYDMMYNFCIKHIRRAHVLNCNGNPYIMDAGLNKFASVFGICELDRVTKIVYKDGTSRNVNDANSFQGEFDYIIVSGIIASTKFGVRMKITGGIKVNKWETDKIKLIKRAETNWRRRGISKFIGIDGLDWSDLNNIRRSDCKSITYGNATSTSEKNEATDIAPAGNGNAIADKISDARQDVLNELRHYFKTEQVMFNNIIKQHNYTNKTIAKLPLSDLEDLLEEIKNSNNRC